jgi:hypothetical protein
LEQHIRAPHDRLLLSSYHAAEAQSMQIAYNIFYANISGLLQMQNSLYFLCTGGGVLFDVSKPETVNKSFRMAKELVEELQKVAQRKKVSLNYLVTKCCEYALKNMPDEKSTE